MSAPHDEAARQRALDGYRIVDTLPEATYDDIVQLASVICETPMAAMTLIDRDRQWLKAARGVDATSTRRDESFCTHAIETPTLLMEVPDARCDSRFESNPFVTGSAGLRFYAGMPLVTGNGEAIGAVCVLDEQPRALDERQREGLRTLARLTMTLLDTRKHERDLQRDASLAESIPAATHDPFAVMIVQVQGLADAARRIGERAIERQLQDLERQLGDAVDSANGDSVNRTSESADFVAVLRGALIGSSEQRLRACAERFAAQCGLTVATGVAITSDPAERIERVYLRADEALTEAKNAAVEREPLMRAVG